MALHPMIVGEATVLLRDDESDHGVIIVISHVSARAPSGRGGETDFVPLRDFRGR